MKYEDYLNAIVGSSVLEDYFYNPDVMTQKEADGRRQVHIQCG